MVLGEWAVDWGRDLGEPGSACLGHMKMILESDAEATRHDAGARPCHGWMAANNVAASEPPIMRPAPTA